MDFRSLLEFGILFIEPSLFSVATAAAASNRTGITTGFQ